MSKWIWDGWGWRWEEDYEEDDPCPCCDVGILQWKMIENCSCHIHPPCSSCVDNILECPECAWEDDDGIVIGIPEFLNKKEMEI